MTNDATEAQNAAADPRFSTWLSANAGSGKTRVLTDRVARLLLAGTEPQNVLCLTYTKAAASEMQNRLFKRLGHWAMLDDDSLRNQLDELGEVPPASFARARTLFARAVETPGGLKIQTIHSFCSAVLRQFPLEAGISPQFRELDEPAQRTLVDDVLDQLAVESPSALAPVARIFSNETLADLALSVSKNRLNFTPQRTHHEIHGFFGVSAGQSLPSLIDAALPQADREFLSGLSSLLTTSTSSRDRDLGGALGPIKDMPAVRAFEVAQKVLLTGGSANSPFTSKAGTIPTKSFREGPFAPHADRFNDIANRVEAAREAAVSLDAAEKTAALHTFAAAFLPAYQEAKNASGALDFDDLIQKTGALLSARSLEWVLYRLDSGIEHILVDEAQDTSPTQWGVIEALAREIISGEGARPGRTLFVVGDKKQSIYSFQGADAHAFDHMATTFRERLAGGSPLKMRELHFSFRSSSAILGAVDRIFEGEAGRGLGQTIQHRAFRETMPGRVDLWPLVPAPDRNDEPEWFDPVDRLATNDPKIVLAEKIAKTIASMIETGTIQGENGDSRPVEAGDFLILVQGRGALFDQIIRACKAHDLPMAGADRLKIAGELAVKDLLALLSFMALQEDDLSLAAALRSPLFGWSEAELYNLAQGRRQPYLWAELRDRRAEFPETFAVLNDLLRQVDFLRPYELLELILSRFDGRRNLLARLGPEAQDGIDELLNQALNYEVEAVPSLTGFLTRAQSEEVEIKRQADGSGGLIRVMTVHGAKGLESPIVILPDTTRRDKVQSDPILKTQDGFPAWRVTKDRCPEALAIARDETEAADKEERQRLLYVAMTRAESWLIVCGTENKQNSRRNWYTDVHDGLQAMGAVSLETPTGTGLRVSHGDWPKPGAASKQEKAPEVLCLPDYLTRPTPEVPTADGPLSPSDLGGEKVTGGGAQQEEAALRYGRQVHRLLELLPAAGVTREAAQKILSRGPDPADDVDAIFNEAVHVIEAHPDLFADEALVEIDVAALAPSLERQIYGTIDRLLITPKRVVAVDFKTNAVVPTSADTVPEGIRRQMGAYLEALEQIFPDRPIEIAILWTKDASLMNLPHGIVREALARTQHLDVRPTAT